jgi:hypothetical protein
MVATSTQLRVQHEQVRRVGKGRGRDNGVCNAMALHVT